jgi:hypothetical protein
MRLEMSLGLDLWMWWAVVVVLVMAMWRAEVHNPCIFVVVGGNTENSVRMYG